MTNGHSHFFLMGDEKKKFAWGDETKLKFELAQRYIIRVSLSGI